MAGRSSWEVPPGEGRGWDGPDGDQRCDLEDQNDGRAELSEEAAGQELVDYLMDMLAKGKRVSARDVCVVCWFAARAGCKGPVEEVAFRPDARSGHYQRHLDVVFPPDEALAKQYTLHVPGYDKYSEGRTILQIPVFLCTRCLMKNCDNQVCEKGFWSQ